ncbi:NAD(P)-dependent oxidoreductase [Desulfosarcina widdelii]|uniref:NAD(P)-dependent oxidoreductase n=1 Tax=Desulfosarcina widdelii TaxID=947919 RepID=A0A5K7Z8G6_9BACT|nr:NAD(P)-dependent oxidoreductase [Desulfosarcina widdelii]BBO77060.1 NAD(P)-dependent oxidoreductase [Desulfosarcina widdelii]
MSSAGNHPRRLLITGASGFLGWHLCRLAASEWSVYGVGCRHRVTVYDATPVTGDLTDSDVMATLFDRIRPQAVIHAAAASDPAFCERHIDEARRINVTATESLAGQCARWKIPFVFTSTDLVFDGTRPPYAEDDATTPIAAYGRQKVEAEQRVMACWPKALICRLPLMIGLSGGFRGNFSFEMLKAIETGTSMNLFADEFRTPVDGQSAAAGILTVMGKTSGILNLGGRRRISRYEMGRRLAVIMECKDANIRPVSIREVAAAAPRSPDVSLNSQRAYRLGYDPADLDLTLERMVNTFRKGQP